MEDMHNHI